MSVQSMTQSTSSTVCESTTLVLAGQHQVLSLIVGIVIDQQLLSTSILRHSIIIIVVNNSSVPQGDMRSFLIVVSIAGTRIFRSLHD